MIGVATAVLSALPSLFKLFDSDERADGVKELTNVAVSQISDKLGVKLESKKDVLDHLNAKPEDIVKLRELDSEYKMAIEQLHAADRANARELQKSALASEDTFSKRFIYYYAWTITIITFAYIFAITFAEIPDGNHRFADTVLGFLLGTGLSAIINFFYGSSKGSADKTDALHTELGKRK